MARLRISSNLRQNERRFYLCQAFSRSSRLCPKEAMWVRLIYGDPTYLCWTHHEVFEYEQVTEAAA
jgi:hypothetical protein